jgi:hypothetical protein
VGIGKTLREMSGEPLSPESSSMHCPSRSDSRTPRRGLRRVSIIPVDAKPKLRAKGVLFPNDSLKIARQLDP